jgi:phytoene dehydrogenase-like protein
VTDGSYDAVIVGAGPNGLAAAITMAKAGRSVLVVEAADEIGGGTRSAELTLPGFVHDVCSAVHPLLMASPFFRDQPLVEHGLALAHPQTCLAHPLDDGTAAVLDRDLRGTASCLGDDGEAYLKLMRPLVRHADAVVETLMMAPRPPRHPIIAAEFGRHALRSAAALAGSKFKGQKARALHAGIAAHAMLPLDRIPSGAVGLMLGMLGHAYGWPVVRGGSQRIAEALGAQLTALGGDIKTGWRVERFAELPPAQVVLFDLTPRQVLSIAGDQLPPRYRRRLERFRYGPGVFKLDWALDGPVPWTAEACRGAGTVHLGGTLPEVAAAEDAVARGVHPDRPFVLFVQADVADLSRSPAGQQTAWAYCHVPNGSTVDMTEAIENQVERFAPGFKDRILARSVMGPAQMEAHDNNYIGGDINGGVQDLRQLFTRPAARWPLYSTPNPAIWFCSSSTPPGGGVHGMCGMNAAAAVLRRQRRRRNP